MIDLNAITAEVNQLSEEDLRKALVEMKTKQKVSTKKYYNPETAKAARQKKAAVFAAMVAQAKALGLYDQIDAEASEAAEAKLAEADEAEADEQEG